MPVRKLTDQGRYTNHHRYGPASLVLVWLVLQVPAGRLSARYDHLREVTPGDVLAYLSRLYGHERHSAISAPRSSFTWAKRTGVIFLTRR